MRDVSLVSFSALIDADANIDLRYKYGKIVEINSHSLFSKWFSESGKLVQRLFSDVNTMVDDEDGFVVVMIGQSCSA